MTELHKYFEDLKKIGTDGTEHNYREIEHFIKICNVIEKTIWLMGKIDKVDKIRERFETVPK
jgi:hypothetical protein